MRISDWSSDVCSSDLQGRVREFVERKIRPAIPTYHEQDAAGDRWKVIQVVEDLKAEAKAAGIWNLFMPPRNAAHHQVDETIAFEGPGLTNLEYALCAEEMGRIGFASEVFNCSAPDTGNLEIGRAHVCTPVTNAHLVCRLLL